MPDSIRIKEIHAALDAGKYSVDDVDPSIARFMTIGKMVELIANSLGLSYNSNGSIKVATPSKHVKPGATIPSQWQFGQFGDGGTPGIVYTRISKALNPGVFNPDDIDVCDDGYDLCQNIPQYIEALLSDLNNALALDQLSVLAMPNADSEISVYQGLGCMLPALGHAVSMISTHTSETYIASLINQAIAQQILVALGLPLDDHYNDIECPDGQTRQLVYPGITDDTSTISQLFGIVLANIGIAIGALVKE